MSSLSERIRNLFGPDGGGGGSPANESGADQVKVQLDEKAAQKLLRLLENTREVECTCDETLALLDEYAELLLAEGDTTALMPLVEHHMQMCPDCLDRCQTLLRILQAGSAAAGATA